jgi:uncharacterized protein (TIGR02118 family)
MNKVTLLYGHPKDPEAFEKYYKETHLPIASKMKGVTKLELTKFLSAPDGGMAAYYRMAELYFSSPSEMEQTLGSPEGQAAVADLPNFATGGVTVIIGTVEN